MSTSLTKSGRPRKKRSPNKNISERTFKTRAAILNAAENEFSQNGFKGASVRDIGERANVEFTLINYHFGNKEQLWRAVISNKYTILFDAWEALEIDEDKTAFEKLKLVTLEAAKFTANNRIYFGMVLREMQGGSERFHWLADTFLARGRDYVLPLVKQAQSDGDLPPGDPEIIHYILAGAALSLPNMAGEFEHFTGRSIESEAEKTAFINTLQSLLFRK